MVKGFFRPWLIAYVLGTSAIFIGCITLSPRPRHIDTLGVMILLGTLWGMFCVMMNGSQSDAL